MNLLAINTNDIIAALNIFWKGMLAIAIVLAIIICVTLIMNKVDAVMQDKKRQREEEAKLAEGENQQ